MLLNVFLLSLAGGIACLLVWLAWFSPDAQIRDLFVSPQALRAFLLRFGWWTPIIFVLLQIVQVIFSPLPGSITTLAGGLIFGLWGGLILSSVGIVVGSLLAFALARLCGQPVVLFLFGQAHFEDYNRFWIGKGGLSLLIFFFLPFVPDDTLCFLAGLSALPFRVFLLFLLIGRLPTLFLTTLLGAGTLTFSLWEWVLIGLLASGVLIIFWKYGDTFEQWVRATQTRRKGSEKKEASDQRSP